VYKAGASNQAMDALSHHPAPPSQLNAVSSSSPVWLSYVVAGYGNDPFTTKLLQDLLLAPDSKPPYTLTKGVLRLQNRIWVGNNKDLQLCLISAMHMTAIGGHSGFPVTFSKLKGLFAWRGKKADVEAFVTSCSVCA